MSLRFKSAKEFEKLTGRKLPVSIVRALGAPATQPRPKVSVPQARLWEVVSNKWPGQVEQELGGTIPGRRYRIDVAFPAHKLAIEVDGWQHHGKYKGDFQRDRERQNLLTLQGLRILRFTAGNIHQRIDWCVGTIEAAISK
jgi:very-short-patch-repair endonuclease